MKCSFFQAAVVSILLYRCTTWTLTKQLKKKLDGNYKIMLRAILNKSWRQHPTRHQLFGHLPLVTKTIQVRRTRHVDYVSSRISAKVSCSLVLPSPDGPPCARTLCDCFLLHTSIITENKNTILYFYIHTCSSLLITTQCTIQQW